MSMRVRYDADRQEWVRIYRGEAEPGDRIYGLPCGCVVMCREKDIDAYDRLGATAQQDGIESFWLFCCNDDQRAEGGSNGDTGAAMYARWMKQLPLAYFDHHKRVCIHEMLASTYYHVPNAQRELADINAEPKGTPWQ